MLELYCFFFLFSSLTVLFVWSLLQKSLIYYLPEEPGTFGRQMRLEKTTGRLRSVKFIQFNGSVFLATLVAKRVYFGHGGSSNLDSFYS